MTTIASKLTRLNTAKTNIKNAIEAKGVSCSGITFENYHTKIAEITGAGTPETLNYFTRCAKIYSELNKVDEFIEAWQLKELAETVLYDIPITRIAENQDFGEFGMLDIYTGDFTQIWSDMNNHTLLYRHFDFCDGGPDMNECPLNWESGNYIINNFIGSFKDHSSDFGMIPAYLFTDYEENTFGFTDGSNIGLESGPILLTFSTPEAVSKFTLKRGYLQEIDNSKGIIIPEGIITIGAATFVGWSNNQPLIIPDSTTTICSGAFSSWTYNDQPLILSNNIIRILDNAFRYWSANTYEIILPNSLIDIGDFAFTNWESNTQSLVIPSEVKYIGDGAFSVWRANNKDIIILGQVLSIGKYAFQQHGASYVGYMDNFIIHTILPPSLMPYSLDGSIGTNTKIKVPAQSVDAYKQATNWSQYASIIEAI